MSSIPAVDAKLKPGKAPLSPSKFYQKRMDWGGTAAFAWALVSIPGFVFITGGESTGLVDIIAMAIFAVFAVVSYAIGRVAVGWFHVEDADR